MLESSLRENEGGHWSLVSHSACKVNTEQVPDADKVLQHGEEVRLSRRVHHQVLHQLKALIHIIQLQSDVVKPDHQVHNMPWTTETY